MRYNELIDGLLPVWLDAASLGCYFSFRPLLSCVSIISLVLIILGLVTVDYYITEVIKRSIV